MNWAIEYREPMKLDLSNPNFLATIDPDAMLGGSFPWPIDTPQPVVESPYLTAREAAAYCGMGLQTFYNLTSVYGSPDRTGNKRYTREALDNWLSTYRTNRKKRRR